MSDQNLRDLERAVQLDRTVLPLLRLAYARAGILGAAVLNRKEADIQKFKVAEELGYTFYVGWFKNVIGLEWSFFTTNVAGPLGSAKLRSIKRAAFGEAQLPPPDDQLFWAEFHKDSDGIWVAADFKTDRIYFTKAFAGVLQI